MATLNKVIVIGRLGADPQSKISAKGTPYAVISVATNDRVGTREETQWHRIKIFGQSAVAVAEHLKKGDMCYVEGRLNHFRYEKDGQSLYATDIVASAIKFLPSGKKQSATDEESKVDEFETIPF